MRSFSAMQSLQIQIERGTFSLLCCDGIAGTVRDTRRTGTNRPQASQESTL